MESMALFRHFRRALRAWQLYPEGSPARSEAVRSLAEALGSAAAKKPEGLSFAFLEEGAWVEGEPVAPEGEEAGGSLGRRIFDLGVREFRFLPGMDGAELARFCDPLSRALLGNLNPIDEDLPVLLWEADLPHVAYLLYQESEEEASVDPGRECREVPSCDEYIDRDFGIGGGSDDWLVRLSEAERVQLLAAFRREEHAELPFKYARLLLELLRGELEAPESERLRRMLREFLHALARAGRFALLLRVRGLLAGSEGGSASSVAAFSELSAFLSGPELLGLLAAAPYAGGEDLGAAIQIGSLAPSESFFVLLERVLEPGVSAPAELVELARRRLGAEPALQELCLRDPRDFLRRFALEQAAPGPEWVRRVLEHLRDPDPTLRLLVVQALGRATGAAGISGLFSALSDPDEGVRIAAAEALGRRGGTRALEPLLRILVSKRFEKRSPVERQAFYLAAGRAAPQEFFPVLARMAERGRSFWHRREHTEQTRDALEALAALGSEARDFVTVRWGRKRPELLSQVCSLSGRTLLRRNAPAGERRAA
jgi:hypothetical protein